KIHTWYNCYKMSDTAILHQKGISEETILAISAVKAEPAWMTDMRIKAFHHFQERVLPEWGADLKSLNFDDILYFKRTTDTKSGDWEEVPDEIKTTFARLGIPEAEKKFLAGVATQYESEVVYEKLKQEWNDLGVVFLDTDSGLKQYP